MTTIKLEEKLYYYVKLREELQNKDIEKIVNARLEERRAELRDEVTNEIDEDITQCDNYINLLQNLINESKLEDEATTIEETSINEAETPMDETQNNIVEGGAI